MKYSIILPVKNGGDYIKECVNSILSQTLQDFNLIVLDNCSTDGTLQWIQSLQNDHITIHTSEAPLSMTENWGRVVGVEKNEFITLIGHDDILHPHYLQTMDTLIKKHPTASLYQTHYKFIDTKGNDSGPCLPMDEVQHAHEFIAAHFARTMNSMGSGYMMRSKDYDVLDGIPTDYPNLIFADYVLWIQLISLSYKATAVEECFSYRLQHSNVSKITGAELYQQAFGKYVLFIHYIAQKNLKIKEVVERYGKDMLMFYCEALSHRLLKTSVKKRKSKVNDFVNTCNHLAKLLIPTQQFEPLKKSRIKIAKQIDAHALSRFLFQIYKKIIK